MRLDGIDTVGIDWALGSQNLMIIHQNVIESFNKSCELVRRERNGSDPVWVDWARGSHNCEGGATISSLFHHQWSPSPLFLYLILNWLPRLPPRCHLGATLPQLGPQDCLVARPQMDSGSIKGQSSIWCLGPRKIRLRIILKSFQNDKRHRWPRGWVLWSTWLL